jgi:hypothetical protein
MAMITTMIRLVTPSASPHCLVGATNRAHALDAALVTQPSAVLAAWTKICGAWRDLAEKPHATAGARPKSHTK